jgi:hypothetical protein
VPGDRRHIGAGICHSIRHALQDRPGGSLEGGSGLLFRILMLANVRDQRLNAIGQGELRRWQSLIDVNSC